MQGALFSAWSKRSRTRAAPTPTNISTNSEPLRLKNGTFASPATARASSVLPVPGGPTSSTPLGIRPPMLVYFFGFFRNSTISRSSSSASSTPATSTNFTLTSSSGVDLRAAARERHHAAFGAAHPAEEEAPERDQEEEEDPPAEQLADKGVGDLAAVLHPVLVEILDELRVLDPDRHEPATLGAVGLQLSLDLIRGDRDFLDLAVAQASLELAVRDHVAGLQREEEQVADRHEQQDAQHVPHGRAGRRTRRQAPAARVGNLPGDLFRHLIRLYARYACTVFSAFANCRSPPTASTRMTSPSRNSPCSTRIASGSSIAR